MPKKTLKQLASDAAGTDRAKFDDEQSFLFETLKGIAALEEKNWDNLDRDVQNWYNQAIDANDSEKDLPSLGDEDETPLRRRGGGSGPQRRQPSGGGTGGGDKKLKPEKAKTLKEGDKVSIETKRKTTAGKVINASEKYVKIETDDGNTSNIAVSRIVSITVHGGGGAPSGGSAAPSGGGGTREVPKDDLASVVGSDITITTTKGDIVGKLTSANDKMLVVETDEGEQKVAMRRVQSVTVAGGGDAPGPGAVDVSDPEYQKTANAIREAIAISPEDSQDDILASMEEQGIENADGIVAVVYHDMHAVMAVLREQEMLVEE